MSGFAAAMKKVLSRELHVAPTAGAVLSKRHTAAAKAEAAERALAKAQRVRSASRHAKVVERNALPSALSRDAERDLRRMATKGVIALFNAVAKHQHATQSALQEPADRASRLAKVSHLQEASFLNLLRDTTRAAAGEAAGKANAKGGAAWVAENFVQEAGSSKGRRAAAEATLRHSEAVGAKSAPRKGGLLDVDGEF